MDGGDIKDNCNKYFALLQHYGVGIATLFVSENGSFSEPVLPDEPVPVVIDMKLIWLITWIRVLVLRGVFSAGTANSDVCVDRTECEEAVSPADLAKKYSEGAKVVSDLRQEVDEARLRFQPCGGVNCSCFFSTITSDLAPFVNGVSRLQFAEALNKGVRYVIANGSVYRDGKCTFPARCEGVEYFFKMISPELSVNVELVVNDFDWPKVPKRENFPPVFSFSKTKVYGDIMYPAWSFWSGGPAISLYPTGIGRWDQIRVELQKAAKRHPWGQKISQGFFRGSRTSAERDSLVLLSRKEPDLVEAMYTKNQAWKSPKDTLDAEPAPEVSFEKHCKYKYLFNFRGVAASFRLRHLFLCGSLVIHVGSDWQEFFYSALKPWIHYVPLPDNPSEEKISFDVRTLGVKMRGIVRVSGRDRLLLQRIFNHGYLSCAGISSASKYLKHGLDEPFPRKYDARQVEVGWNDYWDALRRESNSNRRQDERPTFSMILPPPNVTGALHLGHALTIAIQDVVIKWYKYGDDINDIIQLNTMRGLKTSWTPGFDHAGLATQVVVEKKLKATKGVSRHDVGRVAFLKEVEEWKELKRARMRDQLKTLGASLDWENEFYTLGENTSKFVRQSFVKLFDAGMIYRGERIVNWCPSLCSTVSEVEVDRLDLDGTGPMRMVPGYDEPRNIGLLTVFEYELENPSDGRIAVATTRPETMLGDVALAVHPEDSRQAAYIGKRAKHPFLDRLLPIIADGSVEPTFGTGVVKVTPAHDKADFELSVRHRLKPINIFDDCCAMNDNCGTFAGMPRYEARAAVIDALRFGGYLISRNPHPISLPVCSRTGDIIEPVLREQWFLKSRVLAEKVLASLRQNEVKIYPASEKEKLESWFIGLR
ncbi:unnamed protein product [Notodromas monacha]|uniref:valine--tRNA ligase n=1 Tax=Notodromas monacha TaxID=399045 RepID=A0A7R9BSN0_9CRUS|nr:unnamed protein product [Notodromas monacha]CAG0919967.1 unnamed protein product [Notodromas monacha]